MKRIVILASGDGSLAQAIIDATQSAALPAHVVAVLSDRPSARVLVRARSAGIPTIELPMKLDRSSWDEEMISVVAELKPDLVVSAGFMRILSKDFISRFKTINSHPSLLPQFPGAHAVSDTLVARATSTGATIHWVDDGMDTGEIIAQVEVPIMPDDDESTLHERIKIAERELIVATLISLLPTLLPTLLPKMEAADG